MTSTGYDFVTFFGRNIAAIPTGDRALYLEFVQRFGRNSWKKKAFKALLFSIVQLRLQRFISVPVKEILFGKGDFSSRELVKRLEEQLGLSPLKAVFFYPPQLHRGRCYAYVFCASGSCVAFVKISFDSANTKCLINEKRALSMLKMANVSFQVPTVIHAEFHDNCNYVVYGPFDKDYDSRSLRWNGVPFQCRNEILGLIRSKKLGDCDWWQSLNTNKSQRPDRFLSSFASEPTDEINIGCAHGDLIDNNIYFRDNEVVIVDWEYFSESAPYTVDEVSFYLASTQRFIAKDPYGAFKLIFTFLCDGYSPELLPERIFNGKMALGYLHAMGNSQAILITTVWAEQFEDFLDGL